MFSSLSTVDDASLRDSRRAAWLFFIALSALTLGSALGLNAWPGEVWRRAIASGEATAFYKAFEGSAVLMSALYFAARPPARSVLAVAAAWLMIAIGCGVMRPAWLPDLSSPLTLAFALASAFQVPALIALSLRTLFAVGSGPDPLFERRLRWLFGLILLFYLTPQAALTLSAALHPLTLDRFALNFDRAAGLMFTPALREAVRQVPGLYPLTVAAYHLTPFGMFAVAMRQLRGYPRHVPSALLTWVGMTLLAFTAYHFFPAAGPNYVYGSQEFIEALRSAIEPLEWVAVGPFPRNAMPSMHFGWCLAACILWWRMGGRALSHAVLGLLLSLTTVATLILGEHYVVDLIVAVPFVLASLALFSTGVQWPARRFAVTAGYGAWVAWVILLRFEGEMFRDHPWMCWVLITGTAAICAFQARSMRRFSSALVEPRATAVVETKTSSLDRRLGLMFFFSGAAALVYQVVFAKRLALVFGSTSAANYTVLSTFLGGMALGSLVGGFLAQRVKQPLRTYAIAELGIGLYCIMTPWLFDGILRLYVGLAGDMPPDAPALLALRVVLGASVLVVPTILMGATLPLLVKAAGPNEEGAGRKLAWLYFANTGGAAIGALLTAYAVMPFFGLHRSTLLAALANLLVALAAMELAKQLPPITHAARTDEGAPPRFRRALGIAALMALGVGGMLSLGLEVVFVHLLAVVAGNSVYAFGLMLFTFLLGLSLGGEGGRRLLLRTDDAPKWLVIAFAGLAGSIAGLAFAWDSVPQYFGSYAGYTLVTTFSAREAVRGLVCAMLMMPPAGFIGLGYVLAMDIVTRSSSRSAVRQIGWAAALNTLGNIAGVLLFGFWVLPHLGGLDASKLIATVSLIIAITVALTARPLQLRTWFPVAIAACILAVSWPLTMNWESLSSGANVYFRPQSWGRVVDHAESVDGGLTSVTLGYTGDTPVKTLLTNGKFQGNDSTHGEMEAQVGFAVVPLLHQPSRGEALVIGYGTGVSSRVIHEAGFAHLDIAELSADIVALADRHFATVNGQVSHAPGVTTHVTDGRNLLLLSQKHYDLVSIEISSIWFAGAASLYNRDFYQLVRNRLTGDGVLQQWVQLHHIGPRDIVSILASLRAEFRYVNLYVQGGQGILVATNSAQAAHPRPEAIEKLQAAPTTSLVKQSASSVTTIVGRRLLDNAAVDRMMLATGNDLRAWVSTDDNLRLEYDTPKGNVRESKVTQTENLTFLSRFAAAPAR